ncbi:MAG: putative MarR family transcriptional regulator [Pseudomonas sp.]|nr:putative MarR family transcriptional regulator [Pseudomonas sp.]
MENLSNEVRPPIQLSNGFVVPPLTMCHATSLRKATRRVSQLYDVLLAPSGLRSTQRSILMHIARAQAPTMSDLAAALVLDRSALAHNLKPLERDGLVLVKVDPNDKRSRLITLSKEGENKLLESHRLWESAQQCFETALGVEQADELRASLRLIAALDYMQSFERNRP